jgi:predicted  nucleic acid-binding Zn-ribbon protein
MSNMTLDDLAGIVKGEFDNVNNRFNVMEKRFDNIDNQYKQISQEHENMELKLSNVAYRFELNDLQNQVNILRDKIDQLEKNK